MNTTIEYHLLTLLFEKDNNIIKELLPPLYTLMCEGNQEYTIVKALIKASAKNIQERNYHFKSLGLAPLNKEVDLIALAEERVQAYIDNQEFKESIKVMYGDGSGVNVFLTKEEIDHILAKINGIEYEALNEKLFEASLSIEEEE